jgi:hypothetical protein
MKPLLKLSLLVLALANSVSHASIEVVVIPAAASGNFEILRWSIHRDGKSVKYGRCDSLEEECNPDVTTWKLQRELDYDEYLKRLGSRLKVSEKYLSQHGPATQSYASHLDLLTQVSLDPNNSDQVRAKAAASITYQTQRGGILDRFTQAVAIKRGLEWVKTPPAIAALDLEYPSLNWLDGKIRENGTIHSSADTFQGLLKYISQKSASQQARQNAANLLRFIQSAKDPVVRSQLSTLTSPLLEKTDSAAACARIDQALPVFPALKSALGGKSFTEVYQQEIAPELAAFEATLLAGSPIAGTINPGGPTPPVVTYEKSVPQFELALWPLNFAQDVNQGDGRTVEEPSTGVTYVLAATSVTYSEAIKACGQLEGGFRMANWMDLYYSSPWLAGSKLAQLIPPSKAGRRVWINGTVQSVSRDMGKQIRTYDTGPRSKRTGEIQIYQYDYDFPAVELVESLVSNASRVPATEETAVSAETAVTKYGNLTEKLAVLCVGATRYSTDSP